MIETKRNNMKVLRFNARDNKTFARELIRMSPRSFIFVGNPEHLTELSQLKNDVFNRHIEDNDN